jgi:hypothetical protein
MLGQGFASDQILKAYDELKRDDFWERRFLSMRSVQKQIGEIYKKGAKRVARRPRSYPNQELPAQHRTTDAERRAGAMGADTDVSDL